MNNNKVQGVGGKPLYGIDVKFLCMYDSPRYVIDFLVHMNIWNFDLICSPYCVRAGLQLKKLSKRCKER